MVVLESVTAELQHHPAAFKNVNSSILGSNGSVGTAPQVLKEEGPKRKEPKFIGETHRYLLIDVQDEIHVLYGSISR